MERITDHRQAWEQFYIWVKEVHNWKGVDRYGRDRIGKGQRAWLAGKISEQGVASLLNDYGQGVWEASAGFVAIHKTQPK